MVVYAEHQGLERSVHGHRHRLLCIRVIWGGPAAVVFHVCLSSKAVSGTTVTRFDSLTSRRDYLSEGAVSIISKPRCIQVSQRVSNTLV